MLNFAKKTILVLSCLSSVSAFAITDNAWLKAMKHNFKHAGKPSMESFAERSTWYCVEARIDGSHSDRTFEVSRVGTIVYAENVKDCQESYSFVADKKTRSFTAINPHSELQYFARETGEDELLIELTSKDPTLKVDSAVSGSLKVYGYMSCIIR
ncbi:MAG: hypothetical protein ABIQ95_01525 [Bdellovibrionia bacterium]